MTPSINNIEEAIRSFFENRISYSSIVKQLTALTNELSNSIQANSYVMERKRIAPNIFNIAVRDENLIEQEILEKWTAFAYAHINEIITENSYDVNGPIRINIRQDSNLKTNFIIVPDFSALHSGKTIPLQQERDDGLKRTSNAHLFFIDGNHFDLFEDQTLIGRDDRNNIVLDNLRISRFHAKIIRENDTFKIIDNNSTLGTYINGNKIKNHMLKNGDVIRMGDISAIFSIDQDNSDNRNIMTKQLGQ